MTTPTGVLVGYSGDTAWTDTLVHVAAGADLFIAEAYFYDKKVAWHMDYATLKRQFPRLGARRLIVTHMSTDMLGRLESVDVESAHDGLTIER